MGMELQSRDSKQPLIVSMGELLGWWVETMGGVNRGEGIMGMELPSGDSKQPLFVHMGGDF